jgi:hypothetical protein
MSRSILALIRFYALGGGVYSRRLAFVPQNAAQEERCTGRFPIQARLSTSGRAEGVHFLDF